MGPHSLTESTIERTVDDRTGIYLLYNSRDGPVQYVGISTVLPDRLREYTDQYTYFEVEYHPNQTTAYEREARLFHQLGETDELDNEQHPPRPHQRVRCPVCGIHQ